MTRLSVCMGYQNIH